QEGIASNVLMHCNGFVECFLLASADEQYDLEPDFDFASEHQQFVKELDKYPNLEGVRTLFSAPTVREILERTLKPKSSVAISLLENDPSKEIREQLEQKRKDRLESVD